MTKYEEELTNTITKMLFADVIYGTGFYNQENWLKNYRKLEELVGFDRSDYEDNERQILP